MSTLVATERDVVLMDVERGISAPAQGVLDRPIEAGALVSTIDGGRTRRDRVPGGPHDTHEIAVDRKASDSHSTVDLLTF
jgi:hypothetical protein